MPQNRASGKKRPLERGVVIPPKVRVLIGKKNEWGGSSYADAHFAIRRGLYHYLRWREGKKVREFYLGKLKKPATRLGIRTPAPARWNVPCSS